MDKIDFDCTAIQQNEMSKIRGGVSNTITVLAVEQEHVAIEHEWHGIPRPGQAPDEIIIYRV